MQKRILLARITALLLASALTLAACGPSEPAPTPVDPNAIFTQAAQTAFANVTLTAMAASPTPEPTATATFTPIPTFATVATVPTVGAGTPVVIPTLGGVTGVQPTAGGPLCNDAAYVADVTIPDYTEVAAGTIIGKTWTVKNTGVCTWDDGYTLNYGWGSEPSLSGLWGSSYWALSGATIAPGQTVNATVYLTAPTKPGTYSAIFKMMSDSNPPYYFGGALSITIVVK